jgi:hypothetical protein
LPQEQPSNTREQKLADEYCSFLAAISPSVRFSFQLSGNPRGTDFLLLLPEAFTHFFLLDPWASPKHMVKYWKVTLHCTSLFYVFFGQNISTCITHSLQDTVLLVILTIFYEKCRTSRYFDQPSCTKATFNSTLTTTAHSQFLNLVIVFCFVLIF